MNTKVVLKELFSWVRMLVLAFAVALLINSKIVVNATIPTGSMETIVMTGDRIIGNRLAYLFSEPERGDIIVFNFPDDENEKYLKRIIGLPGEKVEIIDGRVYIDNNEMPLAEDYLEVVPVGDFGPYYVPEGSYFVMGDNRNQSYDSRYWQHTFVDKEQILAKAMFGYYPSVHSLY